LFEEENTTEKYTCGTFLHDTKKSLNMPIYAAIAAIPLALIPGVNTYLFQGSGGVFNGNIVAGLS
jgi:hypothetical protein